MLERHRVRHVVNTATETDNWRKKYFDSLSSIEKEQLQFRAMEAVLKKLAGRLCTATIGLSPRLDDEVRKLQKTLRREATVEEFEKLTPGLTDAIQSLDQPAAAGAAPQAAAAPVAKATVTSLQQPQKPTPIQVELPRDTGIEHERVRAILSALLTEL